ncbi:anion permease [candidate division KSB1 bacterium]|nr:anion permease [candidate division KSB1 bacterium]
MDFAFWYTTIILVIMTILLVRELISPELVIFSAVLLLVVGGIINVDEALGGFSNTGMLTVAFLFIVAAAVKNTGVLNSFGDLLLGRNTNSNIPRKLMRFLFPVSLMSAFFNNTPIVAMLIPTIHDWARKNDYAVSKFLIPLSYAAIVGGMCTLIGTSTNLVVHGLMLDSGMPGMTFFEITKVGLPIAIISITIIALFGYRLLPDRIEPLLQFGENTREFVVALKVEPEYQFVGRTIEQAGLRHLKGLFLFQIERAAKTLAVIGPEETIQLEDRLFFTGLPATIMELQKTPGLRLLKESAFDLKNYDADLVRAYEAVISPSSPLKGMNVRESNFRSRYNAVIIAIHRNGERIKKKIGDIVLREGDTLLMLARHDFLNKWYNSKDFYLISESEKVPSKPHWHAWFSVGVFACMLVVMGLGLFPIVVVAGLAALALIFSRSISKKEAQQSLQYSVLIIIASSFGISKAMQNSGVAEFLAHFIVNGMGTWGTIGILIGVYFMTSFYTEIITNNAAAALLFPIAVAASTELGVDARPFVIAVAIAASASFATPIGYQTNLMVYSPGGYKFRDFLKIGVPMNIFVGVLAILLIHWIYF